MQSFRHLTRKFLLQSSIPVSSRFPLTSPVQFLQVGSSCRYSVKSGKGSREEDDAEWDDAWESAWIPEDSSGTEKAPWKSNDQLTSSWFAEIPDNDKEGSEDNRGNAKEFVNNMNEKMAEMAILMKQVKEPTSKEGAKNKAQTVNACKENREDSTVAKLAKDYRVRKQRIHGNLWLKEIEKAEEAKLGSPLDDDIDHLLDNCSQFFDFADREAKVPHDPNFKVMPEGWEGPGKDKDERLWEISQKEEDILLQEFERRMAFDKIQIAGFVKSHIFSRRRPVDGWKYMIEELGPHAKRGKGLTDGSSRPPDEKENMIVRRESFRPSQ